MASCITSGIKRDPLGFCTRAEKHKHCILDKQLRRKQTTTCMIKPSQFKNQKDKFFFFMSNHVERYSPSSKVDKKHLPVGISLSNKKIVTLNFMWTTKSTTPGLQSRKKRQRGRREDIYRSKNQKHGCSSGDKDEFFV